MVELQRSQLLYAFILCRGESQLALCSDENWFRSCAVASLPRKLYNPAGSKLPVVIEFVLVDLSLLAITATSETGIM